MALPKNDLVWMFSLYPVETYTLTVETALYKVEFEISKNENGFQPKINGRLMRQHFERIELAKAWVINAAIKDLGSLDVVLEEAFHKLES